MEFHCSFLVRLQIKLNLKKYLSDQKGSALVMVLLATVGVAALTLVVIQSRKNGTRLAVKATSDKDVDRALSLINTLLMSPDSCKANFPAGRPIAGSLNQFGIFKKCNDGTAACNALNFKNAASPDWVMFVGEAPSKARLLDISYQEKPGFPQTTGPSHAPATYTIHVYFEKNLGMNNGSITSSFKDFTFEIPLVTGTFNSATHTYTASSTIVGCPRSPSSTVAY